VAQTRGLPFKQEITLAPAGPENPIKDGSPSFDFYNGAPLLEVERAYQSIGLLPRSSDFKKALTEFRGLERLIRYDRANLRVSWSPTAAQLGAPVTKLDPDKARDLPAVFAIMEALQEQHFKWRATMDNVLIEDRRSAFHAVAAGDAALTLMSLGMKKEDSKLLPANLDIAAQAAVELGKLAVNLPDFLRRQLTFPHRHGSQFVYWAYRSKGWQGVDALYDNPPLSTAEILHPEKYFVQREAPLRFFPAQLLRRFKDGAIVEQTLGEDAIAGLLAGERSAKSPRDTAGGWRGDQLFTFAENGSPTTLWFSSWHSEPQAREFLLAYRAVLEARHRVRFDSAASQSNAPMIARAQNQRGWLLQRNDSVVLLVSESPASRLIEIAADAWKDLEIDQETMEIRFESAQAPAQLSLKSR
jgi:hypothetical protein